MIIAVEHGAMTRCVIDDVHREKKMKKKSLWTNWLSCVVLSRKKFKSQHGFYSFESWRKWIDHENWLFFDDIKMNNHLFQVKLSISSALIEQTTVTMLILKQKMATIIKHQLMMTSCPVLVLTSSDDLMITDFVCNGDKIGTAINFPDW